MKDVEFKCIPRTNYKFISFSIMFPYKKGKKQKRHFFEIRFLDSMQFLTGSPDAISEKYNNDFKITRSQFPEEVWKLISQKGVFLYNYPDSFDRLNETKLPDIKEFYDILKLEECKQDDYHRALNVWKTMNFKIIKDYLAVYLNCDVLILADIIEHFRTMCIQYYELDPLYYYTSPNFFWDACLK